ncbi:hypothetical protein [Thalassotalea sp. ND16A]|uniref:hypothetical protein n=1 Tax=Thalassotalea sp. ND16A TaxID=1535422 RepID=UPI00051DD198|nr:hypothetical protein [Thalassotalea sp. ND16A]KGJ97957.1 hypothetical protein ND16A_0762 [Thalassotalea sp. ND16A]
MKKFNRIYNFENKPDVVSALDALLSKESPEVYQQAMYRLGVFLADELIPKLDKSKSYCLASTAEDVDYLARGLLDRISNHVSKVSLACFWNNHHTPIDGKASTAPIIKKFIDAPALESDDIIIVKSVMSGSCVVKTNLTELIHQMTPSTVHIVSPVAHVNAEGKLKQEFPSDISDKFDFTFLAKDEKRNKDGEVIPGIGGNVYQLLGFTNQAAKNRYTPKAVLERMSFA